MIETCTTGAAGTYTIAAIGGAGVVGSYLADSFGALGNSASGSFYVAVGTSFQILVGGFGSRGYGVGSFGYYGSQGLPEYAIASGGGDGGSFIVSLGGASSEPLVVAGGGGGSGAGSFGPGGGTVGGFVLDGGQFYVNGDSFLNGGAGGSGRIGQVDGGNGGFGGRAGGYFGGGGGGGFFGGAGDDRENGTSFVADDATNPLFQSEVNAGPGSVTFTFIDAPASVPLPASLGLMAMGAGALGGLRVVKKTRKKDAS